MNNHAFDLADAQKCIAVACKDFFDLNKKECQFAAGTASCRPDYELSTCTFSDQVIFECNFLLLDSDKVACVLECHIRILDEEFRDRKHGRVSLFNSYMHQSAMREWTKQLSKKIIDVSYGKHPDKLNSEVSSFECFQIVRSMLSEEI